MTDKKKMIIGCSAGAVVLVALLAAFFISSKEFYAGRFSAKAVVSNTDVSAMTVEEAVQSMNQSDGFSIVLKKDGAEYSVDISEAVNREFNDSQVQACKDQISFWDYLMHKEVNLSLKPSMASIDQEALQLVLQEKLPEASATTSDAYFDKELNLIDEVQGDDVNFDTLLTNITTDITEGNELEYELSEYYNQPKVKSTDNAIADAQKKIEKYKNMNITFTFGESTEVIDGAMISKYLSYKNGKLVLKKKWITEYVRQLARKYNTYGKTRKFKTTKDGKIKIHGGIMGWWIDEAATVKKVKKLLNKQKSKTIEPVYRNIAAQHGKDDIGDTYVEVSLKRQKLWFYKNGKKKLESSIVTGLPTKERRTVTGVHRIYGKEKDRYLGTIAVQGYRTHVNYWMPFNWDGQGLHDATWRSKFGGNLYKTGGSHGCVNMPLNKAAELYDMVSIGTPVVVY